MKILLNATLIIALLSVSVNSYSQESAQPAPLYNTASVEVMPEYPGGLKKFFEYIDTNYTFSKEAVQAKVLGRMIVTFVVEADGSLSTIKVVRGVGYGSEAEIERLLLASPKWKPGMKKGNAVRVQYTLPVMLDSSNLKVKP
jgi:periplasmic protein TonB